MVVHEEFLNRLEKRNEYYSNREFEVIGEYINSRTKILCKDKYGECLLNPDHLVNKNIKPSITSALSKTSYFINQAREVHGDRYDYGLVKYVNARSRVRIICPEHGEFEQMPNSHLLKHGCPVCGKMKAGVRFTDWANSCIGNPGTFYVLRCWNETEEFYKVGITCQDSVDVRYDKKKLMPYQYEIVNYVKSEDRKYIWELEKKYLSLLKEYRYEPKLKFGGSKFECFKIIK